MNALGIVFSNLHDKSVPELTFDRTMASVPYGCRYRLVDFPLSNMANAGINHIGIVTHYNYQSLVNHIQTGKEWDLARNHNGLVILPPFISGYSGEQKALYSTRLEAIRSISRFIFDSKEEYVIMSDSDVVANIDVKDILNFHKDNSADITIVSKKVFIPEGTKGNHIIIDVDDENRVTDIVRTSEKTKGYHNVILNVYIMETRLLKSIITSSNASDDRSFTKDILKKNINEYKIMNYSFDGTYFCVDSIHNFYRANMELLNEENRNNLFNKDRPIYTNVHSSPPTRYIAGSKVSNSLIADGCIIEGTVKNSIIFRGVKIEKGAIVENSILFNNTQVGQNTKLNCVLTDKNVIISSELNLSGHSTKPFFIDKNSVI